MRCKLMGSLWAPRDFYCFAIVPQRRGHFARPKQAPNARPESYVRPSGGPNRLRDGGGGGVVLAPRGGEKKARREGKELSERYDDKWPRARIDCTCPRRRRLARGQSISSASASALAIGPQ